MTLPASGNPISLQQIRDEFAAGQTEISIGDLYKGAAGGNALVRSKSANNTAVDQAPNVPLSGSGTIDFSNFFSQAREYKFTVSTNSQDLDYTTIFGDDNTGDYRKTIDIQNGVAVTNSSNSTNAITVPAGTNGTVKIIVDGSITASGGIGVANASALTATIFGAGAISGAAKDDWVPALAAGNDGTGVGISFSRGGFGGASGPDIRHSSVSGNFNFLLKRTGTNTPVFKMYWTYNECDYANLGSGNKTVTDMFPYNADGTFDSSDSTTYKTNTSAGSNGRDTRDIAWGSKISSGTGVREFWFCSNNKPSTLNSALTSYSQPGFMAQSITDTYSRRSSIIQTYNGSNFSGTTDTSNFTGTIS